MPEQNVSHGSAADSGDRGDDNHTKQIHFTTPCRQRAGHGFGGDANNIENG